MEVVIQSNYGFKMVNLNRRRSIREQCLNCSAWVLSDVRNCSFEDCPLYPYRIGAGHQDPKARKQAIRKYCLGCVADQQGEVYKCQALHCALWWCRKDKTESPRKSDSMPGKCHIGAATESKNGIAYQSMA